MKRIYVGNLDYGVSGKSIRELFEKYGTVDSVAFIKDKDNGRFRGFCFINMDDDGAVKAVEKLNGFSLAGRKMEVIPANLKKRRKKRI